jgi:hypothetical protein
MRRNCLDSITDAELTEISALVARGRAIPAVIVAAILRRLEAAEARDGFEDSGMRALAA